MMPHAKCLSWISLTSSQEKSQRSNLQMELFKFFEVFVLFSVLVKQEYSRKKTTFCKNWHQLMLTNVGVLINLLTAQSLFFKAKQTSMENECGWKDNVFVQCLHWMTLHRCTIMHYSAWLSVD